MGWKIQCKQFEINKENIAIWGEKISVSLKSTKNSYMGCKNQCKHFQINKENITIWGGKISGSTLKSTKRV